jgi:hypothetical protein
VTQYFLRCQTPCFAFLAFLLAMLGYVAEMAFSADRKEVTVVEFLGEDGKPISEASFYLYELKEGRFHNAIFRDYSLGKSSQVELQGLPDDYMIGLVSRSNYYKKFWKKDEINLNTGLNKVSMEKSGVVSFDFVYIDKNIPQPIVIAFYRKGKNGVFKLVGGEGLLGGNKMTFEVDGLVPGQYQFELKDTYDSDKTYWRSADTVVKEAEVVYLKHLFAESP